MEYLRRAVVVQLFEIATELEQNMKGNVLATLVPSVITIGGALFFQFGVLSAIWLYNVGFVAGVANAMWPMLKYQRKPQPHLEGASPAPQSSMKAAEESTIS